MKFLIVILFLATQVLSWWENGHMLVAQIAKNELLNSRLKVWNRANQLVKSMNGLDSDINDSFVTSAVWPDDIKDKAMNFWDLWHYYGRPINPNGDYLQQSPIEAESNAMDFLERAIFEFSKDYDDKDLNMQKAIFIRFVLHVVGDLHQPLHNVNMFNATYPSPDGDLGGNMQYIYDLKDRKMLLHSFWDQGAQAFQGPEYDPFSRPLNDTAKQWLQQWGEDLAKEYPKSYFEGKDTNMDFYEWSREAWIIARDFSYPLTYETNQLTEEYVNQAQEICKSQVVLGGYRLANFLEMILFDYDKSQEILEKVSGYREARKMGIQREIYQKIGNLRKPKAQEQVKNNEVVDQVYGKFTFMEE
ncbi:Phospholipase C/P1 nuclease domain [Pseudocohnilembus persalinus]|uniref:Phospholipase C/P1 nuclease domain n=1 Tax=Pseudocohnilembus persalinus TaxID=266149 RepID=A0A0V0QTX2_PSEPJ|nr:Phospholipase C/P1 nuclease domain [Pseudocohnilembus persalinus]|eukprot:KRX05349.1 Phospholipase C/P1 nuclease domain [Pseudocohnilembus persalinus]